MHKRQFYWKCIKKAFKGKLALAESISFVSLLILGIIAIFWPPLEGSMNILLVAIPGAILLGTIILGFILAPYLIYEEDIKVIQQERDELKGHVESKISKRRMRETIAEFLKDGEQIKRQCRNEKEEAPEKAALDWARMVAKYLTENLGSDYEATFYNSDGLPIGVTTISSPEHSRIESYMRNRIARLNQFFNRA